MKHTLHIETMNQATNKMMNHSASKVIMRHLRVEEAMKIHATPSGESRNKREVIHSTSEVVRRHFVGAGAREMKESLLQEDGIEYKPCPLKKVNVS